MNAVAVQCDVRPDTAMCGMYVWVSFMCAMQIVLDDAMLKRVSVRA